MSRDFLSASLILAVL